MLRRESFVMRKLLTKPTIKHPLPKLPAIKIIKNLFLIGFVDNQT